MGSACSTIRVVDKDLEDGDRLAAHQKADAFTSTSCSENTEEEPHGSSSSPTTNDAGLLLFPPDLLQLLQQPGVSSCRELSEETADFVRQVVARCCTSICSDTEALAVFAVLSRVMDRDSCVRAATNLKQRGYPSEAMACLRFLQTTTTATTTIVRSLIRELQTIRLDRWSRMDAELVEYSDFWRGSSNDDLVEATDLCEGSLDEILREMNEVFYPQSQTKFGIQGMLDDTPSDESIELDWSKEGNLNFPEQQKSMALWRKHTKNLQRQKHKKRARAHMHRIDNVYRFQIQTSKNKQPLLPSRLFSKTTCQIYGVRFVKVQALLAMDELLKFEDVPTDAFAEKGHFAVSYRWGGLDTIDPCGYTLERLKEVLTNVDGIQPDDGVFLDWCCAPTGEPLASIFAKAIYEQCHVIFLPSPDFFTRSWCTFECMAWLLSPFPNQALGDYNFMRCIYLMCAYHFGRPPFVLDRPELQVLGRVCMGATDARDPNDKEFLTWALGENNRIKSTGLRESLTKLTFKFESTVIV
jgi:hypothetical protein